MRRLIALGWMVALALPAVALASKPAPARTATVGTCIAAWNARAPAARRAYAAPTPRAVDMVATPTGVAASGGVDGRGAGGSTLTPAPVASVCMLTIGTTPRHITRVFARWSHGAAGAWHESTGSLGGTAHLSFNARLLPNGTLQRD